VDYIRSFVGFCTSYTSYVGGAFVRESRIIKLREPQKVSPVPSPHPKLTESLRTGVTAVCVPPYSTVTEAEV
jgi:hypothetical protein